MKVLVIGGAGYIGSITNSELKKANFETVVFDSLEHGHKWAIKNTKLIRGNLLNLDEIKNALKSEKPNGVIHFAAYIEAGESMIDPAKYYRNNVIGSLNLLDAMVQTNANNLVFSSTAAVYGNPKRIPIAEKSPKKPTNCYGETKLAVEKMVKWFHKIHNINYVTLRYFNASGATVDGSLGEAHQPESHIIPIFLTRILQNKDFAIFGDDYNTPDGTCVRDYIHVNDLASAHILALKALLSKQNHKINTAYNVGTGKGYSNKEIAEKIIQITKTKKSYQIEPRRSGDPDELVANSDKIKQVLSWSPRHSDLETIITTAFRWHKKYNGLIT
jgi:UDP-glucose 4-epimerase